MRQVVSWLIKIPALTLCIVVRIIAYGRGNVSCGRTLRRRRWLRLGLEGHPDERRHGIQVVFRPGSPRTGRQWASKIYESDSEKGTRTKYSRLHNPIDELKILLVVMCGWGSLSDYSVACLFLGIGIKGEKGNSGSIRIIATSVLVQRFTLENVPRLLNSPANARGLNFAIILNDLLNGCEVEWRAINVADWYATTT